MRTPCPNAPVGIKFPRALRRTKYLVGCTPLLGRNKYGFGLPTGAKCSDGVHLINRQERILVEVQSFLTN